MTCDAAAVVPAAVRRTALVVVVDGAEPLVGSFRLRHDKRAVDRRIPPHVTVLIPFVPAAELDREVRADLESFYRDSRGFAATLSRIAAFPQHVWLAPEPRARFLALIRSTYARFPQYPPYGGEHPEPEPHLTVGEADAGSDLGPLLAAAECELAPGLPLPFRVERVTLLAEGADATWNHVRDFRLG